MISEVGIQIALVFKTYDGVNQTVDLGERIGIFWASFVQIFKVDVNSPLVILLLDYHNI